MLFELRGPGEATVFVAAEARQRNQRQLASFQRSANLQGDLHPANVGQSQVQEGHVDRLLRRQPDGIEAVEGGDVACPTSVFTKNPRPAIEFDKIDWIPRVLTVWERATSTLTVAGQFYAPRSSSMRIELAQQKGEPWRSHEVLLK